MLRLPEGSDQPIDSNQSIYHQEKQTGGPANPLIGPDKRKIVDTKDPSGNDKTLLMLNILDINHVYSIELSPKDAPEKLKNVVWVEIRGVGEERVKADISSIAERLGISPKTVIEDAINSRLDDRIQKVIDDFEVDLKRGPLDKNFEQVGGTGRNYGDLRNHIASFLSPDDIENLNSSSPETEKKIDPTAAKIAEAKRYGFDGTTIEGANQFMENHLEQMESEAKNFLRDGGFRNINNSAINKFLTADRQEATREKLPPVLAAVMDEFKKLNGKDLVNFFASKNDIGRTVFYYGKLYPKFVMERGNEALVLAAENGDGLILEQLLGKGANAGTYFQGKSPLHLAVSNHNGIAVFSLLLNGADVNVRDTNGNTPLHLALSSGDVESMKLLIDLSKGLRYDIKNNLGLTVADLFKVEMEKEVKGFMENYIFLKNPWGEHLIKRIKHGGSDQLLPRSVQMLNPLAPSPLPIQPKTLEEVMEEFKKVTNPEIRPLQQAGFMNSQNLIKLEDFWNGLHRKERAVEVLARNLVPVIGKEKSTEATFLFIKNLFENRLMEKYLFKDHDYDWGKEYDDMFY